MSDLQLGLAEVRVRLRHANLKDKRNLARSFSEKCRNLGFSVSEIADQENPQVLHLGLAYVGAEISLIEKAIGSMKRLLGPELEVLGVTTEIRRLELDPFRGLSEEEEFRWGDEE